MAGGYRALDPPVNEDDTVSHLPPIESMNTRHRREIAEQERRFEIKRREERRREAREQCEVSSNRRIESLEEQVLEVVRCMITACEGLENELRRVTAENNELRAKQAQLEIALAELRLVLAERAGKVIDHPLRSVH